MQEEEKFEISIENRIIKLKHSKEYIQKLIDEIQIFIENKLHPSLRKFAY